MAQRQKALRTATHQLLELPIIIGSTSTTSATTQSSVCFQLFQTLLVCLLCFDLFVDIGELRLIMEYYQRCSLMMKCWMIQECPLTRFVCYCAGQICGTQSISGLAVTRVLWPGCHLAAKLGPSCRRSTKEVRYWEGIQSSSRMLYVIALIDLYCRYWDFV